MSEMHLEQEKKNAAFDSLILFFAALRWGWDGPTGNMHRDLRINKNEKLVLFAVSMRVV